MSDRIPRLVGIVLAGLCLPTGPFRAEDRATEAIRREAEKAAEARERAFKRLASLPAPPPEVARMEARFGAELRRVNPGMARPLLVPRADALPDDAGPAADEEPRFEFADESFNLQVLGTTGDDQSARDYLNMLLEAKIRDLGRARPLTTAQQKRLLLAGRGDIKRLFDRIEDARRTFQELKSDLERCAAFLNELHPLSRELRRGPFGPDSILEKTLRTMREQDARRPVGARPEPTTLNG